MAIPVFIAPKGRAYGAAAAKLDPLDLARAASAGSGCRARGRTRPRRCRGSGSRPRRRARAGEAGRLEGALDGGGDRVAAADQAHVAAEDPLQHRRHQRVVGAAEDQGVDLGPLQRRAVGAGHLHHALVEGRAVLDEGRQVGRLDLGHLERAALGLERAPVGAALDRVRRRQHPDPAAVGDRRRDLGLRLDHRDHLHPVRRRHLAGDVVADRGRRVAGDHQQLRAVAEQQLGDRAGSARAAGRGRGCRRGTSRCRRGRRSPPPAARRGTRGGR